MTRKRNQRPVTKSPRALARLALDTAKEALSTYSGKFSKRTFKQSQIFAILVLKSFFRTDDRGIVEMLNDWKDLQKELWLQKVPHFSTLWHAEQRLLKKRDFDLLQRVLIRRARKTGLLRGRRWAIVDATGLETRHISRYFLWTRTQG